MNDVTLIRSDLSRFSRGTVRVGIEPTGYARWFGRLLGELVLLLSARAEAQKDFSFGTSKLLLFDDARTNGLLLSDLGCAFRNATQTPPTEAIPGSEYHPVSS